MNHYNIFIIHLGKPIKLFGEIGYPLCSIKRTTLSLRLRKQNNDSGSSTSLKDTDKYQAKTTQVIHDNGLGVG